MSILQFTVFNIVSDFVMNNNAVNIFTLSPGAHVQKLLLGICLEAELLGHIVCIHLALAGNARHFLPLVPGI